MTIVYFARFISSFPMPILLSTMTLALALAVGPSPTGKPVIPLRVEIVDADTGRPVAARVYIQAADGTWYFPRSARLEGSAIPYKRQSLANPVSIEMHTTLSAHPFVVDLPPGPYTVTVERGKEYLQATRRVTINGKLAHLKIRLRRWIDMSARGWYSGDTHVHRSPKELPNVMLAEDLNVAFPLSYWVSDAFASPASSWQSLVHDVKPGVRRDPPARQVAIDATHSFWPRNTEYEISNIGGKRVPLGAFLVINHHSIFDKGAPPVGPVGEQAHREGALIAMDKHNWFWSMMLVPVMPADLYELSNNHVWRTAFGLPEFGEAAPDYMRIERDAKGWTERGWIEFGLRNYYTLLDFGFRLRPTAGTASGVHPVPLGFSRVYVHLPGGFNYESWVAGLNEGRSFVTTGPMLFAQVNGQDPGHAFRVEPAKTAHYSVTGTGVSSAPLKSIEIIVNGNTVRTVRPANRKKGAAYESEINESVTLDGSGWIAVRCWEEHLDGRVRFAHTGPFHVEMAGYPLHPRPEEAEFLIQRMEDKVARTEGVFPEEVRDEYRQALRVYQERARTYPRP